MDIGQLISDLLRSISFFLDKLVYGFVGTIYNLLVEIAQTSIFTDEVIDIFAGKIYALLGIFMLFKVSFSILTYIVSPDDFIDKNKGFSKLISNILITLTLLVITPWLFTQAMDVQRIILRDNVIGKIFINTGNGVNMPTMSDPGNLMAYQTYKAFFHVDTSLYPNCVFDKDGELNSECRTDIGDTAFDSAEDTLKYSEQTNSVSIYMDDVLLNLKSDNGNKDYVMVYFPFISVIVGIVLLLLLIVFCFDIAVRSIKLGFLRMLAPIPIVSRIDPKKGKEVFDKWFKMVLSTYLDLFIRLIAIYFAVFVISLITQNFGAVDAVTGLRKSVNPFVIVFIILGSLLFAKQLPKLIEDLTGFKMDGKLTLNPLKKLSAVPVVGGAAAAGGVLAGGALMSAGTGVASLLGGGAKMAAGTALSKITGGKRGSGLVGSGRSTIIGTREAMGKRWSATAQEARGRMSSSGFMGSDEYKGDTAGKILAKEREKRRSDVAAGKEAFRSYNRQWLRGDQLQQALSQQFQVDRKDAFDLFDGQNTAAYSAVYKSQAFRDSLMRLDAADSKLKEIKKEYDVAYSTGTLTAELQERYEKQSKAVKGLESVHDTMRKTYATDAQTQDAIKFRKYNANNPTGQ